MKKIDRDGRKIRGYAIISKGDVPQTLKRGVWRIPSQSGVGDYLVKAHANYRTGRPHWECSCPDWMKNSADFIDCKHIHAIRFWLELKDKLAKAEPIQAGIPESVREVCPHCRSERLIKRGVRKNTGVQKQRHSCKACGKRFVLDIAKKTKGNGQLVTLTLDLYFKGLSLRKIQHHLTQFYGFEISHMTIQRWIHKFMAMANQHAERMMPKNIGGLWHADEQMIKSNGGYLWIWNCMDARTRFLLANNVTESRFVGDAQSIFMKAKAYGTPDIIVTDGLQSYRNGIRNVFGTRQARFGHSDIVKHVRADGLNSKKKNNNKIERFHNTFRERDKVLRGFKGQDNAAFMSESFRTYYNHVKPHMALGGLTPAQVNGIAHGERNKWMHLLRR